MNRMLDSSRRWMLVDIKFSSVGLIICLRVCIEYSISSAWQQDGIGRPGGGSPV